MAARPDCSKYVPIHRLIAAEYKMIATRANAAFLAAERHQRWLAARRRDFGFLAPGLHCNW